MIEAGLYDICGPFLEPRSRMESAARRYRTHQQLEQSTAPRGIPAPATARNLYVDDVATLVALLVINHRIEDAKWAYQEALQVFDDDEFRKVMDWAMTGHLPTRD